MSARRLRCAIYTRKSTEEGLDQAFNSLDAQREACAAYIRSQAGEGWTAHKAVYDDGGYSGGSLERPAIQRLLADIAQGRIDVVVVYKVDRLTRSLADFAKMVELFDAHQISFVSVTQSFNTTTSMGRLTLNVLLSFAQFEREVTGERIRDKFAASKAKGIWMGGAPPLGYDLGERALVVNETEAALVRRIYERYLALGSIHRLALELEASGARTKSWVSRAGRRIGGRVFSRGAVNHILTSRIYRGELTHKGRVHPGAHQAIVEPEVWDAVAARLKDNHHARDAVRRSGGGHLLTGLMVDDAGNAMSPTHAVKGAKRYRYYVSSPLLHDRKGQAGELSRLPAAGVDAAILAAVKPRLHPNWLADASERARVRGALVKVEARSDGLLAHVQRAATCMPSDGDDEEADAAIVIKASLSLRRRGGTVIVEPSGDAVRGARIDRPLLRAVVLSRRWAGQLASGEARSARDIARRAGLCHLYVGKLLPLAFLAPDLVELVLAGRQPRGLSISSLLAEPLPLLWREQHARFRSAG